MSLIVILLKNVNGKAYFLDICMSEVLAPTRLCSSDTKKGRNSASSSILPSNFVQLPLVITLSAQVTYLPWLPHLGGIHKHHQISE